jgi:dimethylargininase
MGYEHIKSVVMCLPEEEYFEVYDFKKHNFSAPVNRQKALIQFNNLKNILISLGVKVFQIKELEGHPNSVFTRDTAVVLRGGFIKLRMGLPSRRGEEEWMSNFLLNAGIPQIAEVKPPLTAEGGDIIIGDNIAFIGVSTRTNESGTRFIASILSEIYHMDIEIVHLAGPYLHLGGAMSLVGEHSVLYCKNTLSKEMFEKHGLQPIGIECNEFIGGNVIGINNKDVIVSQTNQIAAEALLENGFTVHQIELSEFVNGNGGPSCMILPFEY